MKAIDAIMTGKAAALSAVLCLALCAVARPPERQKVKYTPEELTRLRAEAHQKMLERTGGYVMKPGVGRGMVMFFNAQKRVAESNIVKVASSLVRPLRIKVAVERIEGAVTSADAGTRLKKSGAAAGVFVVDDAANPNTLLVAPEGRWAIVNVAALAADGAAEPFVVARTQKEAMRAFLFAFNAGDSQSENSLMGPIAAGRCAEPRHSRHAELRRAAVGTLHLPRRLPGRLGTSPDERLPEGDMERGALSSPEAHKD